MNRDLQRKVISGQKHGLEPKFLADAKEKARSLLGALPKRMDGAPVLAVRLFVNVQRLRRQ